MPLLETPLPDILYRGKVRDTFDLRRWDAAHGRDRPHIGVRRRAPERHTRTRAACSPGCPSSGSTITGHIVPNHFIALARRQRQPSARLADHPKLRRTCPDEVARQAMVVKRAERIDAECVVRAYLTGSALVDYNATGTMFGVPMAPGLVDGSKLPELMFTPTTKAEVGHDEPVSIEELGGMVGADLARNAPRALVCRLPACPRCRGGARHHYRGHQVRVRHPRRRGHPHRRGAHARFEPVLGRRFVQPRAVATQLR